MRAALVVLALAGGPEYAKDFEAFVEEVDKSYPFFDLKGIRKDWAKAKKELTKRARACRTDGDFLKIVVDACACLRDAHLAIEPKDGKWPEFEKRYVPGISFLPATDGRVVVMHGPLPTGTVVTKIDGKPARAWLEEAAKASWAAGGPFSSPQRARLFVYRTPFAGERGDKHEIRYLDGRQEKSQTLYCQEELGGWPHTYHLPAGLVQAGKSLYHARLESGVGYMYWRRVDESVWKGVPQALAAHPDCKGWIVDLRGNGGGGYGDELIAAMKSLPRPVAVLLDAGCISAGETAARDLVELCDARLFGETTAGSSTSKREWSFPSGIAVVRFSTRSRNGVKGKRPIEFFGIEPDEPVEAVPEELLAGKNSGILRAEAWILK